MSRAKHETLTALIRAGLTLEARCTGCHHRGILDPQALLGRRNVDPHLAKLAPSLRCVVCGERGQVQLASSSSPVTPLDDRSVRRMRQQARG